MRSPRLEDLLCFVQVDEQLYQLQHEKADLLKRIEEDQEDLNELMAKHKALIAQVRGGQRTPPSRRGSGLAPFPSLLRIDSRSLGLPPWTPPAHRTPSSPPTDHLSFSEGAAVTQQTTQREALCFRGLLLQSQTLPAFPPPRLHCSGKRPG